MLISPPHSPAPPRSGRAARVAFVSLGCPKNLVDSETMLGTLDASGFTLVSDHDDADVVVINTCGFLDASRVESLDAIREAVERKRAGKIERVVVAGCLVQRHRARLFDWAPGIDAMIGVFDRDHIVDAVSGSRPEADADAATPPYWIAGNALQAAQARGLPTVGLTVHGRDGRGIGYFEDDANRFRLTPRHWSYLRVSEGCNQRCTFCTIPSIRGKMRSKPLAVITREARRLMADGVFELNLIGQDTTSYGADLPGKVGGGLVDLLTALDDVADGFGGGWIRLMYAYPTHLTDAMIDAMAGLSNVVKYLDIPLQHISDRMLGLMRRRITRARQEAVLARLRERNPGLAIRTTLITGFPGETEDDHRELLAFVEDFEFDMLGVFRYSREDGTPAGTADKDPALHVPEEVKRQREEELMLAQQRIAFENARFVAAQRSRFDVLIDGPDPGDTGPAGGTAEATTCRRYVGRCYHQAPQVDSLTYVESTEPLTPGELVRCTVVDARGYDLVARPTDQAERVMALPIAPS